MAEVGFLLLIPFLIRPSDSLFQGAETSCSVYTKRVCVSNTEPKVCTVGVNTVHKNLGTCTV